MSVFPETVHSIQTVKPSSVTMKPWILTQTTLPPIPSSSEPVTPKGFTPRQPITPPRPILTTVPLPISPLPQALLHFPLPGLTKRPPLLPLSGEQEPQTSLPPPPL